MERSRKYFIQALGICLLGLTIILTQCSKERGPSLSMEEITARLDQSLPGVSTYEVGQSRESLSEVDEVVKAVLGSTKASKQVEERFIAFLNSNATLAGKQFICRKLSQIGSSTSLPTLSKMLQEEATFDMALYALERIPSNEVDKTLRDLAPRFDGRMKIGVVNTLGARRDGKSVESLRKLIYDPDPELSEAAVSALGRIANAEAAEALAEAIEKSEESMSVGVLDAYLKCADRMAAEGKKTQAVAIYEKFTKSDFPDAIRSAALTGLILAEPDDAGEKILNAVRSGDASMVSTALYHMSRLSRIDNLGEIVDALPSLESTHQVQLISALAERGDRSFQEDVVKATASEDVDVRLCAFRALASLGDASTVDLLSKTAAEGGPEAETARESLARLSGDSVDEAILMKLVDAEPNVKVELLRSIGARSMKSATENVLACMTDPTKDVRQEAVKTLGLISSPTYLPKMIDFLVQARSEAERREAEKSVVAVAHRIEEGKSQAVAVLAVLPDTKDLGAKLSLINVLGRIGDASALPEIRKTIQSDNVEIQKAGIRALSIWPTAEPMADLLQVAETSKDKSLQILALRGYIRSIGLDKGHSDDEKPAMYQKAYDLSSAVNEKRMVLSGLAETRSLAALTMAEKLLDDSSLKAEAEAAVLNISRRIWEQHPSETVEHLQKVMQKTRSEDVRQQARSLIERIEER
ncbi:MAG: HEAT repeat domain-containing protein [bacterium]